jgi:protein TonB
VASASNTRIERTAVDAPAAEATASASASERETPTTGRSVPVAATAMTPSPGAPAAGAPTEQLAALAPSARPKGEPVQLHPRKHDPPEFPGRALRARVLEGHVLAHLWVTAEGTVDQVDIVKATPTRVFDEEVKRALSQWTFDPPGRATDTTVELNFKQ